MGFTGAFTTILTIASLIAFAGAVAALALVRSSDFVTVAPAPGDHRLAWRPEPRLAAVRSARRTGPPTSPTGLLSKRAAPAKWWKAVHTRGTGNRDQDRYSLRMGQFPDRCSARK